MNLCVHSPVASVVVMSSVSLPERGTKGEDSDDGGGVGRTCDGDTGKVWDASGNSGVVVSDSVWDSAGGESGRACIIVPSCASST